jgi:hypothetical protein
MTPQDLNNLITKIMKSIQGVLLIKASESDDIFSSTLNEIAANQGYNFDNLSIETPDIFIKSSTEARNEITENRVRFMIAEMTKQQLLQMNISETYIKQGEKEIEQFMRGEKGSLMAVENFADVIGLIPPGSYGQVLGEVPADIIPFKEFKKEQLKAYELDLYKNVYMHIANNLFAPAMDINGTEIQTNDDLQRAIVAAISLHDTTGFLPGLPSEYGINASYVAKNVLEDINNNIAGQSEKLKKYWVHKNNTVYMTEGSRKKAFLLKLGSATGTDSDFLWNKYSDDYQFQKTFDAYWPIFEREIYGEESTKGEPNWNIGAAKLASAYVDGTAEWIGTIIGPTEKKPDPMTTLGPLTPEAYQTQTVGITDNEYQEFLVKNSDPTNALKIVKSILGATANLITQERLEQLTYELSTGLGNLSLEDYQNLVTTSDLLTGYNIGRNVLGPSVSLPQIKEYITEKESYDIADNDELLSETVNDLFSFTNWNGDKVGFDKLNIMDPESPSVPLTFNFTEQLKTEIANLLKANPFEGLTAEEAGQKVLETMGVNPEGDLVDKPKVKLSEEAIKYAETTPTSYGEVLGGIGIDAVDKETARIAEKTIKDYDVDKMLSAQYDDRRPPGGAAFGLPGFANVEEAMAPVTNQEILNILKTDYADQPEFLKFLLPNIDYLKEQFLKTQTPSIEQQEASVDLFTKQQTMREFEKNRPKSIKQYLSGKLPGDLRNQFQFSDLGRQYSERIKQEQEAIDERNRLEKLQEERNQEAIRRRELSSPVTIFGRRRR